MKAFFIACILLVFSVAHAQSVQMYPKFFPGLEYTYRHFGAGGISAFGVNGFLSFSPPGKSGDDMYMGQLGLTLGTFKGRHDIHTRYMHYSLTGNLFFESTFPVGLSLRYHVYDNVSRDAPLYGHSFDAGLSAASFLSVYYSYSGNNNVPVTGGSRHSISVCLNLNLCIVLYMFQHI